MPKNLHVGIKNNQYPFSVRSINFYRTWAGRSMVHPCPISFFIFINTLMILTKSPIFNYLRHTMNTSSGKFGLFMPKSASGEMKRSFYRHELNKGYTLVEMVIVVVVLGILSAVAIPRIIAKDQHNITTLADELRRNLSYVQLMAISQSKRMRVSVTAGGYTIYECTSTTSCAVNVPDPINPGNFTITLPTDITFTSGNGTNLDFDSLGRPQQVDATSGKAILIDTKPARSYTLSGSGRSVTVEVAPITGFAKTT